MVLYKPKMSEEKWPTQDVQYVGHILFWKVSNKII